MVAEADESDRSFLKLLPTIAVITNIDHEHLESYGGFDDLQQAFVDFANKVPFYGAVVALRRRRAPGGGAAADDAPRDHLRPRRAEAPTSRATDVVLGPMTASRHGARAAAPATRRARRRRSARSTLQRAGPPQPAERAGGGGRRPRARPAVRADRRRARASSAAPSGGSRSAARRTASWWSTTTAIIRPRSPRCWRRRATLDRRVVVVFQPHRYTRTAALLRRLRPGAGRRRSRRAHRHLRGRRGSDCRASTLERARRRGRGAPRPRRCDVVPRARRRARRAWRGIARPGDVVITLGAGSIGTRARSLLGCALAARRRRSRHESGRRAGRPAVPSRARQAGAAARPRARRAAGRVVKYGLLVALARAASRYRGARARRAGRGPAGRPHRRARQRAAVGRRGARGCSTGCGARTSVWTDLDEWRQRLLASPWVRDAALRRSLPSTVEVVGVGARADRHRADRRPAVPRRRARRASSTSTARSTPSSTCRSSTA